MVTKGRVQLRQFLNRTFQSPGDIDTGAFCVTGRPANAPVFANRSSEFLQEIFSFTLEPLNAPQILTGLRLSKFFSQFRKPMFVGEDRLLIQDFSPISWARNG